MLFCLRSAGRRASRGTALGAESAIAELHNAATAGKQ
jgi:hypothetical protein